MNTNIMIFRSQEFGRVRTMTDENGEPWFAGKDVAVALGYKNPANAIKDHVENEEVGDLTNGGKTVKVGAFRSRVY